ncbi:hypothetical protein L0F81_22230 [Streptomyces tricolor]|uniref:Uncharacterized protein n=1 Tax=Streptomyces tricolor TaxID=68277 RepID=A0ABS9JK87_9ACTN|nr:hypothetical protein [Streptomyces tricolor]MCG0065980.1 hypothetical protein [Streptomyces tricolor]
MTAHQRPEVLAQAVFDALQRAGMRGMSLAELIGETGYTKSQVRRGIALLRESLPGLKGTDAVYTWDPSDRVYRTFYLPEVAEVYEILRMRSEATRSARVLTGTIIPHARKSRSKQLRMLKRHYEFVVEEATELLEPAE